MKPAKNGVLKFCFVEVLMIKIDLIYENLEIKKRD